MNRKYVILADIIIYCAVEIINITIRSVIVEVEVS